jgi:hypothetical protein
MPRLAGASPPAASLRGLDADKWQRGHVGPPVAVAWWQPDITAYGLPAWWRRPVRTARLRSTQGPGRYIASASQVLVSALWRRYGVGSLAHRAGSAVACGSAWVLCSWQLWCSPAAAKLHNAALPSVSASQSQAPFVAATASRPSGEGNGPLCKIAFAGYGHTAVGASRSHSRPTRRRLAPLWLLWHRDIGQALRAVFWSVACGHSLCVCPAHPCGPRRCAAFGPALGARPPPRGSLIPAQNTSRSFNGKCSRRFAPALLTCHTVNAAQMLFVWP